MPQSVRHRERPDREQFCWHASRCRWDSGELFHLLRHLLLPDTCLQAESVSYHLGVPVLFHSSMKPSYSCIRAIRTYFSSLPRPVPDSALVIVGDRIFTDVVLANRMRKYRQRNLKAPLGLEDSVEKAEKAAMISSKTRGPLSIWTTRLWKREATVIRFLERKLSEAVKRWTESNEDLSEAERRQHVRDTI